MRVSVCASFTLYIDPIDCGSCLFCFIVMHDSDSTHVIHTSHKLTVATSYPVVYGIAIWDTLWE